MRFVAVVARNLSTPTRRVWALFCILAGLSLFVPLDPLTQAALRTLPFSNQPPNTILLLRVLKICLPLLGILGILWLNLNSQLRRIVVAQLRRLLESRLAVPLIVLLALCLQIAWLAYYPTKLYADSQWYYEKGIDLAAGRGYIYDLQTGKPTAAWPVGYPAALAVIFAVTGPSQIVAKLANVVFATLTVLATYLLGRRLFSPQVAVLAALSLAILPGFVVYSSLVASDILFLLLMVCVLRLALVDENRLGLTRPQAFLFVAGIGLLNGLMALVRSTGLVVIPALGVIHWLATRGRSTDRRSLGQWFVALAIGTGLVLVPWTIRNYVRLHEFIMVSTNGGLNFWIGNNPLANGGYVFPRDPEHNPLVSLIGDEIAVDKAGYHFGMEFVKQNPVRALSLLPAKVGYLYYANDDGLEWDLRSAIKANQPGSGAIAHAGINASYVLLALASGAGLAVLIIQRKRHPPVVWTGVIFAAGWTLAHLPFFGTNRFALPVIPFLAIYGAFGVLSLISIDEAHPGQFLGEPAQLDVPAENRR